MSIIEDKYRDEFDSANLFTVPKIYGDDPLKNPHEPEIVIAIHPVGGGTPGEAYANNRWIYEVRVNGDVVMEGDDLRSNATPATAEEMSRTLANFLEADDSEGYEEPTRGFLETEGERLGAWGSGVI